MAPRSSTSSHALLARQLQDTALRYFLEVVRCGSISEASARLNVASSAISRHISKLESLVGAPLFDRQPRGMAPSAAGEVLAAHAQRNAFEAERVLNDIGALQGMRRGRVRLVSGEGFAIDFLPQLIGEFVATHPGIQFNLRVGVPADCTRAILQGDADIGLTMSRNTEKNIRVAHRQPAPLMAAMRRGHPLAKFRQLSLAQLRPYPIALPEPDTTARQLFDIVCSRQRLSFEPTLTSNYMGALFHFPVHNDGVTISGDVAVHYLVQRGDLVCIRLRERGFDLRDIEVQTLMGRTLPHAAQAFLEYLSERLATAAGTQHGSRAYGQATIR